MEKRLPLPHQTAMLTIYHIHLWTLVQAAKQWTYTHPFHDNLPYVREAIQAAEAQLYPQSKEEPHVG